MGFRFISYTTCNNCPGDDLERVAIATGATICSNIEQISPNMLGVAGKVILKGLVTLKVSEIVIGNSGQELVIIEECKDPKSVSIMVWEIAGKHL